MNAILYARVSTDKQADKDLSIPAQLQAMRDYARQRGWSVIDEFIESGASAKTSDRPELQRLLARVREPEAAVNIVLVHKIDRLARNVFDHATIKAFLKKENIRLASVVENMDDSISGQLVENIMASIAQFYSANLGGETRKGMRQKVQQGGWPHRPPLGYRIERTDQGKSRVVSDPSLAPAIRHGFERYSQGLTSLNGLRLLLFDAGVTTGRGRPLPLEMTRRMLKNRFYAGRLHWGGAEYSGSHEPLVSEELFATVQRVLHRRFRDSGEKGTRHFLLRGFAFCAVCGGKMTAEYHPRGSYYRCIRRAACRAPYANTRIAERCFDDLCSGLNIPANLKAAISREAERALADRLAEAKRRAASLQMQKTKLIDREVRLTETFAAGDISLAAYRGVMPAVRNKLAEIEHALALISKDPRLVLDRVNRWLEIATSFNTLAGNLDAGRQTELFRRVFKRLLLDDQGIVGFELLPPFDKFFLSDSSGDPGPGESSSRPVFKVAQVSSAINTMFEHDPEPFVTLLDSKRTAAA